MERKRKRDNQRSLLSRQKEVNAKMKELQSRRRNSLSDRERFDLRIEQLAKSLQLPGELTTERLRERISNLELEKQNLSDSLSGSSEFKVSEPEQRDFSRLEGYIGLVGEVLVAESEIVSKLVSWKLGASIRFPIVESTASEAGQYFEKKNLPYIALNQVARKALERQILPHEVLASKCGNDSRRSELCNEANSLTPHFMFSKLSCKPGFEKEVFEKLICSLISFTLILSDYRSACRYIEILTQAFRIPCPEIRTLDGRMLSSNGIRGGKGSRMQSDFPFGLISVNSHEKERIKEIHKEVSDLESLLMLMAKRNQIEAQENDRKAEVTRLHEENQLIRSQLDAIEEEMQAETLRRKKSLS
jgi:hypothetical protein